MFLALLLAFASSEAPVQIDRAARFADSYQPQAPTVRMQANIRCVTTHEQGLAPVTRCDL